ncbi:MAG: pyrroline-5-carboxylate reductase [Planctomycetota bacterium]|nr:MAG: pyrroline-5-carboxylate reductase [Planctomycetota bacterium]REJ94425.1 MAG: pyrroline-5-carboxylate reductase [Planctomycetota bacterium]REK22040.1 MAG: pyrroline-5-carboxylate reductase [Planctomycetota bacterium]REK44448.1 MAG: pyrroline-5-carboxylate reductase [Planctomycetota bacterium]
MTQPLTASIGFVGAGRMAQALARGFVSAELVTAEAIVASDPTAEAREAFVAMVPGCRVVETNDEAADADVVFLAVKPQQIDAVLAELADAISTRQLVVSIAAGVRLARLAGALGDEKRFARVMPNTPCLVGESASAFCLGGGATAADGKLVQDLLSAVGMAVELPEEQLDAVTGLSGSGPAFVCVLVEALTAGGIHMGLEEATAARLAVATVRGTGTLLQETGEAPEVVRARVSSPGGTTLAGLAVLEEQQMRSAVTAAVEAATRRSIELGE